MFLFRDYIERHPEEFFSAVLLLFILGNATLLFYGAIHFRGVSTSGRVHLLLWSWPLLVTVSASVIALGFARLELLLMHPLLGLAQMPLMIDAILHQPNS